MADKLDSILNNYVAQGTATKEKLLGAAFIVVTKDGTPHLHPTHQVSHPPTR
jgi:hypothetical protein